MTHLVRHRTAAGDTVTAEVDDLDAAVTLVERLRNEEAAEDVRVYAEVPLRFETYVRVSLAGNDAPAPETTPTSHAEAGEASEEPPAPVAPPPGVLAPVRVEAPSADAEELVDAVPADGRRGLFHRS